MKTKKSIRSIVKEYEIKVDGIAVKREYLPSLEFVKSKGWISRVYFSPDTILMISFFINAIEKYNDQLYGYVFSGKCISEMNISKTYEDIFNFLNSTDVDCPALIFTSALYNKNMDFLFIHTNDDKYYGYGHEDFIQKIMPITLEMYKIYFNGYTENSSAERISINLKAMEWFWENYPK